MIWGILHYRVMGDVYVELGVVFRWFWALLHYYQSDCLKYLVNFLDSDKNLFKRCSEDKLFREVVVIIISLIIIIIT